MVKVTVTGVRWQNPPMSGSATLANVGVVFVEYHSGGLVADRASEMISLGCAVVVADNSGCYGGPGRIVDTGGNVGFGRACNLGVSALPSNVDVVILHNPDARIDEQGLVQLVSAVRSGWAAVAPALAADKVRPYGFAIPGPGRELLLTIMEVFRIYRGRGITRPGTADVPAGVVERAGRFGSAALLALDRAAFEAVTGFDEEYFLYVEDLDLWYRMEAAGFRVGFAPSVIAHHEGASGSPAGTARRVALRWLGREIFAQRRSKSPTSTRIVHRIGAVFLPRGDDLVDAVRAGFAQGRSAAELNEQVRGFRASSSPQLGRQKFSVGWSRFAVALPPTAVVLDVGSGAFPNARANVLCERSLHRPHRDAVTDRPLVVADAQALPFRRDAVDFVIASHLAEHVSDPRALCRELARVATSGYIETPGTLFERLFPEDNHLWRVRCLSPGLLSFTPNVRDRGLLEVVGERLRPIYYAGKTSAPSAATGVRNRMAAKLSYVLRGALNRLGVTVTRTTFGPSTALRVEICETPSAVGER